MEADDFVLSAAVEGYIGGYPYDISTGTASIKLTVTNDSATEMLTGIKVLVTLPAMLEFRGTPTSSVAGSSVTGWTYGSKTLTLNIPSLAKGVFEFRFNTAAVIGAKAGSGSISFAGSTTGTETANTDLGFTIASDNTDKLVDLDPDVSKEDKVWVFSNNGNAASVALNRRVALGTTSSFYLDLREKGGTVPTETKNSFEHLIFEVEVQPIVPDGGGAVIADSDPAYLSPETIMKMFNFKPQNGSGDFNFNNITYNPSIVATANPTNDAPRYQATTSRKDAETFRYDITPAVNGDDIYRMVLASEAINCGISELSSDNIGYTYAVKVKAIDVRDDGNAGTDDEHLYTEETFSATVTEPALNVSFGIYRGLNNAPAALQGAGSAGSVINAGDDYVLKIDVTSEGSPLYDFSTTFGIPEGVAIEQVCGSASTFLITGLSYTLWDDTAGSTASKLPGTDAWTLPESVRAQIKFLTVKYADVPGGVLSSNRNLVIQGKVGAGAQDGARLAFPITDFSYRVYPGGESGNGGDNHLLQIPYTYLSANKNFTDYEVVYTVGAVMPLPLQTAVYEGIAMLSAAGYFSGAKAPGQAWNTETRFAVTQGQLDRPFVFYIIPNELSYAANARGLYSTPELFYNQNNPSTQQYSGFRPLAPNPVVSVSETDLGGGYKLALYTAAPGAVLRGLDKSGFNAEMILVRNNYTVSSSIAAGGYPIYVGMGSLAADVPAEIAQGGSVTDNAVDCATVGNLVEAILADGIADSSIVADADAFKTLLGMDGSVSNLYMQRTGFTVNEIAAREGTVQVRLAGTDESAWASGDSINPMVPGISVDVRLGFANLGTQRFNAGDLSLLIPMPSVGDVNPGDGSARGSRFNIVPLSSSGNFKVYIKNAGGTPNLLPSTQYQLQYSTQSDTDYGDTWSGLPTSPTRSVKLTLTSTPLKSGETVYVQFTGYAQVTSTYPRPSAEQDPLPAYSTMGYSGTTSMVTAVSGETGKVTLRLAPTPENAGYFSGRVYFDPTGAGNTIGQYVRDALSGLPNVTLRLWRSTNAAGTEFALVGTKVTTYDIDTLGNAGKFNFEDIAYDNEHYYRLEIVMPDDAHVSPITGENPGKTAGMYKIIDGHVFVDFGTKGTAADPTAIYLTDDVEPSFDNTNSGQTYADGIELPFYATTPLVGTTQMLKNADAKGDLIADTSATPYAYLAGYTVKLYAAGDTNTPLQNGDGTDYLATVAADGSFAFQGGLMVATGEYILKFTGPSGNGINYSVYDSAADGNGIAAYIVAGIGTVVDATHTNVRAYPNMRYTDTALPTLTRTDTSDVLNPATPLTFTYADAHTPLDQGDVSVTIARDDLSTTGTVETLPVSGGVSITSARVLPGGSGSISIDPTSAGFPTANAYTVNITVTDKAGNVSAAYSYVFTKTAMTVTFDGNGGGTPSPASKTVQYGSAYGGLAAASRTGYDFAGWYTLQVGGDLAEATTSVSAT
ncbi:MAG: InlB B-repeat-containing protein [Clostridiales Family XIII bacterium]|nr:InlB B-repeat-containing protein [Clostridiales Family XIII bacterium]